MDLKETLKKPENYLLVGAIAACASVAMCRAELPESREVEESKKSTKVVSQPREEAHDRISGVIRSVVEDESPTVRFGEEASLYKWEQGLADCITSMDNTCYLRYDLSSLFRTRLECYSNAWDTFAKPVGFTVTGMVGEGMQLNMHSPTGEIIPYDNVPSPNVDKEGSETFYTQVCQDALQILQDSDGADPCSEGPDTHACLEAENNADWAASLDEDFQDSYQLLLANEFVLQDIGMHVLRVEFETVDGGTQTQSFFPKQSYCYDGDEGPGVPCWKFEPMRGGAHQADELLNMVIDEQLRLYKE